MLKLVVEQGDALEFDADVLAIKYAQDLYGLDDSVAATLEESGLDYKDFYGLEKQVAFKLMQAGIKLPDNLPKPNESLVIDSEGVIAAKKILLVGVEPLHLFRYGSIRRFGRQVLNALLQQVPNVSRLVVTGHGVKIGLDGTEAFQAEIAGFLDAVSEGSYPRTLSEITVVERNEVRARVFKEIKNTVLPHGLLIQAEIMTSGLRKEVSTEKLRSIGYDSDTKPHVFVAMPFSSDMDDVYHFGIQNAVREAGYLCERADTSSFTADVMEWVRTRIATAEMVIGELSGANPNVYLEIGYAWGQNRPTVLIVKDIENLKFDVKGHKCLEYKRIIDLEKKLTLELKNLKRQLSHKVEL